MQPDSLITAIVLTYNEEIHIDRCLKSLIPFFKEIWVRICQVCATRFLVPLPCERKDSRTAMQSLQ